MAFKKQKIYWIIISLIAVIALVGCGSTGAGSSADPVLDPDAPTVTAISPADEATDVAIASTVTATFSAAMDPETIVAANFTLAAGTAPVSGAVSYNADTMTATFTPAANLATEVTYTATITTAVTDADGNALAANKVWTFTTVAAADLGAGPIGGPAEVDLQTAANYVILTKTGVSATAGTLITGDVGVSPGVTSSLTGFDLTLDGTGDYATSALVVAPGKLYAADMAGGGAGADGLTPTNLSTAVGHMEAAYTDAANRPTPDELNLGAGDISGLTLDPGLYKWGTGLQINSDLTLWGADTATWIFQISGQLTVASGVKIILTGGALPENIVWVVADTVTIGTTAEFAGTVLAQTDIPVLTGASVDGRLLAQTAVTLQANRVTQP